METLKDIPTIRQHFLFFYTQGSASGNIYDNQIVSSAMSYGSFFSSLTGIDSVSGEMTAGNFKITLTMGAAPMNYPTFQVEVDHYTTGMHGETECHYTEPVIFNFPCSVTTKGAAATGSRPAIASCTQNFLIRVIIANHQMPLTYYGAHSSIVLKGDRGSVGVSTTAGRRASKTYDTYTKIVDGVSTPNTTVVNNKDFSGYPGSLYQNGYSCYHRPGIYTALTETQLTGVSRRIYVPYSTFILEEYGLPGTLIAVDPGIAAQTAASPSPYGGLQVYSSSHPEISGTYYSIGDPYTLVTTVNNQRTAFRFAKVNQWGFYTTPLDSATYYPPAGVEGWTCLDTNTAAPAEQTEVPHLGWTYGEMIVNGSGHKIVSPKVASPKSPAPSYSLGGQYNSHDFYEANLPLPSEIFDGYSQPNHRGATQSFWQYLVFKDDDDGYVLSDTLAVGSVFCPVEIGGFPCALPVAPPSVENYTGNGSTRDVILKVNNMAININRSPSAFNQYAILGKADDVMMDVNLDKLSRDAMIAGGIWGYYPLARQLQVPTATAGDPSYPVSMSLQHTQTSSAECSVHLIEDTHSCDLNYQSDRSWRSKELTGNFMPTRDYNSGLYGPTCYDFRVVIELAGIGTYSLSDNGTTASGNLVTFSDYQPSASGMTETYSFSCSKNWSGNADCVSRNGDMVDSLHKIETGPIPFQISAARNASMTITQQYYEQGPGGSPVLQTQTMPYSAELSYQKNGAALWEDSGSGVMFSGPNRVGGVASVQLVSGYAEKSPQAADQISDTAQLYTEDLHRVYTTANAYMLHNGRVAGTGTATFKRMTMGPNMEPGYETVVRDVGGSYQHSGVTALASDEPCLIPKNFSAFPVSPKSAGQADDLFVRMCAKVYFAHESNWTNPGRKLSYCRIEVKRVIDMQSSIMAGIDTDGMTGSAITTISFVERRNKEDVTVLYEKFYDASGDKFEELVSLYRNYFPLDWNTAVFPEPPISGWVDPNLPYLPSPRDLTFIQKHTAVVTYLRRNRTEITLTSQ